LLLWCRLTKKNLQKFRNIMTKNKVELGGNETGQTGKGHSTFKSPFQFFKEVRVMRRARMITLICV
jgi:hypothetical protein